MCKVGDCPVNTNRVRASLQLLDNRGQKNDVYTPDPIAAPRELNADLIDMLSQIHDTARRRPDMVPHLKRKIEELCLDVEMMNRPAPNVQVVSSGTPPSPRRPESIVPKILQPIQRWLEGFSQEPQVPEEPTLGDQD